MKVGDRVEVPPWRDEWMQGDRYGKVIKVTEPRDGAREIARVRLDVSGRTRSYYTKDLQLVEAIVQGDF